MAGGPTLNQLKLIGMIRPEECICNQKKCKECFRRKEIGCDNCCDPAYTEEDCKKCREEK
jgi:hypothetical protein